MKSIKAILIMSIWTIFALIILYLFDAHINYRQIQWSIGIALALLIVHMVNMVTVSYTHLTLPTTERV